MKNNLARIGLLLLVSIQWVCAQEATDGKRETAGRKAWIFATTMPDDVDNPLKVLAGEKLQEVRIYSRSMGQPVELDETGMVRAVKEVPGEDGKMVYENLSQTQVPEGMREALIVLVPKKAGADGLRFKSKVIDLARFKRGGCLYVNLVSTKIGVTLGDLKTVIAPGKMEFINPLGNKDKAVKQVQFFYESPKGDKGEWKLMTSGKMAIYKSRREICVFFYNEQIENVDFRGIPFMIPEPRPQPKKP
jgi:hypothetical protein